MRTRNVMRNTAYAVISYALLVVLGLLVRKCFVECIDVIFLGYEGLFGNVFSLLALADFGIDAVVYYRLFPAFSKGDEAEINRLTAIYKSLYRMAGMAVLVLGIAFIPFLQFMIADEVLDWNYIRIVYLLQLSSVLCTYFLAYKRILFSASQKESENIKTDFWCSMSSSMVKILVITVFRSYILYLLTTIVFSMIANCLIALKAGRELQFVDHKKKTSFQEIQELGIWEDLKNGVIIKICGTVYGGTDNIIISAFLGLKSVGIYSNYMLVSSKVSQLITRITNPLQASIGNFIYSTDKEEGILIFRMFDLMSFFLASFAGISYFVLFNPFISLVFGKQYCLGMLFVSFFSINVYMAYAYLGVMLYRNCFGRYDIDRKYTVTATLANIMISLFLVKPLGIAGVMLGTAVSQLGFWFGRAAVVFKEYVIEKKLYYILRQFRNLILFAIEAAVTVYAAEFSDDTAAGFIIKMLVCIMIPNAVNLAVFYRSDEMDLLRVYIRNICGIAKSGLKKKMKMGQDRRR